MTIARVDACSLFTLAPAFLPLFRRRNEVSTCIDTLSSAYTVLVLVPVGIILYTYRYLVDIDGMQVCGSAVHVFAINNYFIIRKSLYSDL